MRRTARLLVIALVCASAPLSAFAEEPPPFHEFAPLLLSLTLDGVPVEPLASVVTDSQVKAELSFEVRDSFISALQTEAVLADPRTRVMFDLYKGAPFAGERIAGTYLDEGSPLSLSLDTQGDYFAVAYAVLPPGEYPPGFTPQEFCTGGDICLPPLWDLTTMRSFFTDGSGNAGYVFGVVPFTLSIEEESGASSVLFLPGFLGSRLYTPTPGEDRRLWEPNGQNDIRDLALNSDGTSKLPVYVGDIVDRVKVGNLFELGSVYGELMAWLEGLKSQSLMSDWAGYAYDWRYDVFDIVDDGTLRADGTRTYLVDTVEALAETSATGRVTLIGHSNGGLLAKALMIRLRQLGKESLVDRVVLIASPQLGTPKGLLGILHGREIALPFVGSATIMRQTSSTLPGAYALAPSSAYYERVATPVAVFGEGAATTEYKNVFGETVDSLLEAVGFMTNSPSTRDAPPAWDTGTPLILPSTLVAKASATHALLDAWVPAAGTEVNEIAGWGNETVTGARYYTRSSLYSCTPDYSFCGARSWLDYKPILSQDGDDTVVTPSALSNDGVYFDLNRLASLENNEDESRGHQDVTESKFIHEYISRLVGVAPTYRQDLFLSAKPIGQFENIQVSVHSPAVLHIEDALGNKTGMFPIPGSDLYYVREEIPGSSVQFGGEGKYVSVPSAGSYTSVVNGTGLGTFTLEIEAGDIMLRSFVDLPVSTSTIATTTFDGVSVANLMLDVDGDGEVDALVDNTLTRKQALVLCRKEVGKVATKLIRMYLSGKLDECSATGHDSPRMKKATRAILQYLSLKRGKGIPPERAAAIATCVTALENTKK